MTQADTESYPGAEHTGTAIWLHERPLGYAELDWVNSDSLMYPLLELTPPRVDVYVDLGTGTGAVLRAVGPRHGLSIGVDVSRQMLDQVGASPDGPIRLIQADASEGVPIASGSAGLVTERMMLHDLPDPTRAIREAWRILGRGGQFVASEYVVDLADYRATQAQELFESGVAQLPPLLDAERAAAPSRLHVDFMRSLFVLKNEPNRYLWTGAQFRDLLSINCPDAAAVETFYSLKYMSVANWLGKSGFPIETCKQEGLIGCLAASDEVKDEMGLTITINGEEVPRHLHGAVLEEYRARDSAGREAMVLDAHWFAAFANVRLTKA